MRCSQYLFIVLIGVYFSAAVVAPAQKKKKNKGIATNLEEVEEVFRVSRTGTAGASETRERLQELFELVAAEADAEAKEAIEAEKRANPVSSSTAIVKSKLSKPGTNGQSYVCLYEDELCVIVVKSEHQSQFVVGEETPPLTLSESGSRRLRFRRKVADTGGSSSEPGSVSFFGIVMDVGQSSAESEITETSSGKVKFETKQVPKYMLTGFVTEPKEPENTMTTERFVEALKNGALYTVKRVEKRVCEECRGQGRVPTTKPVGYRDVDGKMSCKVCKEESGEISVKAIYQIVW